MPVNTWVVLYHASKFKISPGSGNIQGIAIKGSVGFEISPGIKVSVVGGGSSPPPSDTSSPVVKVSGYTSSNASATSNVFVLKEVTSEFSVGDIVTFGDSKKEHEIVKVKALNKSESGNSQSIILMDGVGFVVKKGWKVSVVKETDVEEPVRIDYSNGSVYVGEIVSGKPHGQGTFTSPNGYKYEGEWKDGKPVGQGTEIFPDGSKGIGEFRDSKRWNTTHWDKNGNIIYKVVNGKTIKP